MGFSVFLELSFCSLFHSAITAVVMAISLFLLKSKSDGFVRPILWKTINTYFPQP